MRVGFRRIDLAPDDSVAVRDCHGTTFVWSGAQKNVWTPFLTVDPYGIGVARIAEGNGSSWSKTILASGAGPRISVAFDSNGILHVLYGQDTRLVHLTRIGGSWAEETVDSGTRTGDIAFYLSMAVGRDNIPRVAYLVGSSYRLMYATREPTGWMTSEVDRLTNRGLWVSLAVDGFGNPHLAYEDLGYPEVTGDLWYATTRSRGSNSAPQARISVIGPVQEGSVAHFSANGSTDADGDALRYRWDFQGDGVWDTNWSSSPLGEYTWGDDWAGFTLLEATDGFLSGTAAASIVVSNSPPDVAITASDLLTRAGVILFSSRAHDSGSDDVTFAWDFGDKSPPSSTTFFNNGVSPDPFPSPWGFPVWLNVTGTHVYRRSGDYQVTLTVTDDDGGVGRTSVVVHVSSSVGMKQDAIARLKALKEQALARGDLRFVHELDEAETHVWKSLGYTNPFRPDSVAVAPAADVTVRLRDHDKVELTIGASWDSRLGSFASLRIVWSNNVVTVLTLPSKWPDNEAGFRARPWVDGWHQDVRIEAEREHKRSVTVEVHAHQASLGFDLYLDSDNVANFSFTYGMRPLWTDASHLDPKLGHKVFDEETKAVRELLCGGDGRDDDSGSASHDLAGVRDDDREHDGRDRDDHDHDHEGCGENRDEHGDLGGDHRYEDRGAPATAGCPADPRKWSATERAALNAECDLIANLLVKADEFLALTAIQDPKDTAIQNPKNAKHVIHEIAEAERELARAYREWDEHEYADAIQHFEHAWRDAECAIERASQA